MDEYGVLLLSLFAMRKIEASEVSAIIIASVVPPLETTLRQVCERYFNLKPMLVEPGIKTGMPILVDNPAELGADRLANGVAAFAKYGGPCVVVDFGTATTFDVITAKGEYVGGVIAPGLAISAEALFSRAAKTIPSGCKEACQGGWHQYGRPHAERVVLRLHRPGGWHPGTHSERDARTLRTRPAPKIIATGGLARLIVDDSRFIKTIDDMLTLDGLRLIYERNRVVKVKHSHSEAAGKHA